MLVCKVEAAIGKTNLPHDLISKGFRTLGGIFQITPPRVVRPGKSKRRAIVARIGAFEFNTFINFE
jgi:hypothetical protein